MSALTIPRHTRDGCLYEFPPDARAAMLHDQCATRARYYNRTVNDPGLDDTQRKVRRQLAREHAADARHYFAQWMEARR